MTGLSPGAWNSEHWITDIWWIWNAAVKWRRWMKWGRGFKIWKTSRHYMSATGRGQQAEGSGTVFLTLVPSLHSLMIMWTTSEMGEWWYFSRIGHSSQVPGVIWSRLEVTLILWQSMSWKLLWLSSGDHPLTKRWVAQGQGMDHQPALLIGPQWDRIKMVHKQSPACLKNVWLRGIWSEHRQNNQQRHEALTIQQDILKPPQLEKWAALRLPTTNSTHMKGEFKQYLFSVVIWHLISVSTKSHCPLAEKIGFKINCSASFQPNYAFTYVVKNSSFGSKVQPTVFPIML